MILFPQRLCNQRTAAYPEHIADRAENIQHRHNQVDSRKFRLARKVCDKISVRDDVHGSKQIHHDRRQRKAQQFPVCKML